MAFPDDIFLPANSKEFGFVDTRYGYNAYWDIVWSFSFALTGTEHAFSTFLTTQSTLTSGNGGQYLGYINDAPPYILIDPSGEILLDENDSPIYYNDPLYHPNNGVFTIAFDSTGLFALPISGHPGVDVSEVKQNALIIRDDNNNVLFNEHLSSLSTEFFLSSSIKVYQTLRFRFSNSGKKLSIDFKNSNNRYTTLTSIPINYGYDVGTILFPAFTFCSPISSLNPPSTIFLKNFHTQGNIEDITYEVLPYTPLSASIPSIYTTLSGISAFPL